MWEESKGTVGNLQNAVLCRSALALSPPSKNAPLGPRVPMSTFSKPSKPMLGVLWFEGTQKYKTRTIEPSHALTSRARQPHFIPCTSHAQRAA